MIIDKWDKGIDRRQASLALESDGTLTGGRQVNRWAKGRHIHFAMQLSRKPDRVQFFGDDDKPAPEGDSGVNGNKPQGRTVLRRCRRRADPDQDRPLGVDVDGAKAALAAEVPGWDFDGASTPHARIWAKRARLRARRGRDRGSAHDHGERALSLLPRADALHRSRWPLCRAWTGRCIRRPGDAPAFSTYSLWDTYRALHPLLTLVQPERAAMFTRDLIRQTQQSPYGPPVWPLQGVETGTMIGWHSVSVLAEAHAKGIEADYAAAWPNIRRRAFDRNFKDSDGSLGRGYYYDLGYIPADKIWESVSRTQEYAYDDWAMAVLADAAGAKDDADDAPQAQPQLPQRARCLDALCPAQILRRQLVGDITIRSRSATIVKKHRDYTEANGWQATFLNQHDIYGQIDMFGGDAAFEKKLDELFNAPSTLPDNAPPDISGLVGQYAHGNEPNQHAPISTPMPARRIRRRRWSGGCCTEMYKAEPDGVIGNDDCGQMSAWFVLSALGFYPVDPVSAVYVFGSPLFDRAEVRWGRQDAARPRARQCAGRPLCAVGALEREALDPQLDRPCRSGQGRRAGVRDGPVPFPLRIRQGGPPALLRPNPGLV